MDKRAVRYKYLKRILLILFPTLLGAVGYYIVSRISKKLKLGLFNCVFYKYFGISCLGCGGTRSLSALLRFDLYSAFFYYPPIPICALFLFLLLVFYGLSAVTGKESFAKRFPLHLFFFVPLLIVLLFFTRLILSFLGISCFLFFI